MILDEIVSHKRDEVRLAKSALPEDELRAQLPDVKPPLDFRAAVRAPGLSLIAEVKLASPVKGVFLPETDPVDLGALYEDSGATILSVLTDEKYFKGSLKTLTSLKRRVSIPCMRKDFIIDPYQILEARVAGADAFLLIVRSLSDLELRDFIALGRELGMYALVEAHDAEEIARALGAGAHVIGINNRDLATFEVDITRTFDLKKAVPGGVALVSESGIFTGEHARLMEEHGVDAILVGEALVTSGDIPGKIQELLRGDRR